MEDYAVLALLDSVIAECRRDPSASRDDVLVALARAKGFDLTDLVLVSTCITFRYGKPHTADELMTRRQWRRFKRVARKQEIDFGEINGKHSQIIRNWLDVVTHIREPSEVALALLTQQFDVDNGFLANWAEENDADSDSDDDSSTKRAECEDAELPPSKRVAPADS